MNEQEALHNSAARHAHNEIADFSPEEILGKKASQKTQELLTRALWMAHYTSFIEGNLANIEPIRGIEDEFN